MRYIQSIHLTNFQSHKDSTIHLSPPGEITAICGPSDVGKSTIIRALSWLFCNDWEPSYLRHGARTCTVEATYNDGHALEIRRAKSGGTSYTITFPDKTEQRFEGIGRNVPQEVQTLTGVHPVEYGDFSFVLNIAKQSAGPFLGPSVSSPGRARILGALAGTEEIDLAVRMGSNQLTKDKQEQKRLAGDPEKHTTGEIGTLDERLQEFEYLDDLKQTIEEVSALLSRVRSDGELRDRLARLGNDFAATVLSAREKEREVSYLSGVIDDVTPPLSALERDNQYMERFTILRGRMGDVLAGLNDAVSMIALTADSNAAQGKIGGLEANWGILDDLTALQSRLDRVRRAMAEAEGVLDATQDAAELSGVVDSVLQSDELRGALGKLAARWEAVCGEVAECGVTLDETAGYEEALNLVRGNEGTLSAASALRRLEERRDDIAGLLDNVARRIVELGDGETRERGKYVALLKAMGICELCGSEITEEGLRRVV